MILSVINGKKTTFLHRKQIIKIPFKPFNPRITWVITNKGTFVMNLPSIS
jgi:hypothetical protein